jgi:hypothetical protein
VDLVVEEDTQEAPLAVIIYPVLVVLAVCMAAVVEVQGPQVRV